MRLQKFESPVAGEAGIGEVDSERRRWFRTAFLGGGSLEITLADRKLHAIVVDSNEKGFGIETQQPIAVGHSVTFAGAGLEGCANVVHCTEAEDGHYHLGLELTHVKFAALSSFDPAALTAVDRHEDDHDVPALPTIPELTPSIRPANPMGSELL